MGVKFIDMLKRKGLYCFFILLLSTAAGMTQIKCKIEHYSTENGLSHDGVRKILKDCDGFMWFGTWDGINRFDGQNFVTYKTRPGDSSSLKINRIDNIVEDNDGYLWLEVYDNQIYRFDKRNKKFLAISKLLPKENVNDLFINGVVLTGNGFVWLMSQNGKIYSVKNTSAKTPLITSYGVDMKSDFRLPSKRINFLYSDKQKQVWIGTENGLSLLSLAKTGTYKNKRLDLNFAKDVSYTCIAEDQLNIWLGTKDGYLVRYEKASGRFSKKKISGSRLNKMLLAKNGKVIYITGGREVIKIIIQDLHISSSVMPGNGPFLSLFEDKSGLLWIEPDKHGLIKYNPATGVTKYFFQENDANFFNTTKDYKIFEDHNGRVWMCMKGGGFGYYNPSTDTIEYFYNKPGSVDHLFSNIVSCSYFDPAGILWLSTRDRGVEKVIFQANDFKHKLLVDKSLNKSDNEIRGVYSDRNKRLWITAKSGKLYVYDQGKKIKDIFINEPKGGLGLVYTLLQDQKGNMWLGTKGNGLFKAEPADKRGLKFKLTHYRANSKDLHSLSSDMIYSLLEDKKGRIWLATYENGINQLVQDGGEVRFINNNNSFSKYPAGSRKVRHLQEDVEGNIWIATTNGLVIFNPDKSTSNEYKFKTYGKVAGNKNTLGNNDVQYIYKDSKNRMWVATSGGGLNRVTQLSENGLKVQIFTMEDGLPSDYILSVVEDNAGNLWLGTENGISKFNPEKLQFRNYDSYDGLPKTGLSEACSLKLPNGELFFGCINGYIIFNPATITDQKINAKMALTSFQINNKDINPDQTRASLNMDINAAREIKLNYNENIISIDFTVLDYRSTNKQLYAYRLKGFDTEWQSVKNQRKATYTNLPPGNYIFEVKSLNTDLYGNAPVKTLAIKIAPPPWRTLWAYLSYAILLGIFVEIVRRIVFTMIRLRNRITVEQRLTELKLSFFTNISHELRTPLTLIVNPIEEISRQENLSAKGQEYINVVRRNANRMVRFINQLLDFRKAQSGKMKLKIMRTEVVALVNDIASYFSELARERQIELLISANTKELYAWIDAEKIDIVIYNLLSNAFKFTADNKVIRIEINHDSDKDQFTISVIDQGIGVPPDQLNDIFELYYEVDKAPGTNLDGTGIGLALSKEIVTFHHGNIEAMNNREGGLKVDLKLKMGKDHFIDGESIIDDLAQPMKSTFVKPELVSHSEKLPVSDCLNRSLVLIVDDNGELRKFLADQLKEFYNVVEAKDGLEGLETAIKLVPDLILSDVMMPELNGIQLLDSLKNNIATSHIPVVLLTAKSSVENQIEGLKYGADYYITKPFQTDFILASIDNLLKQRKKIFEALLARNKTIELSPGEIIITSKDESFLKEIIEIVEGRMVDIEFNIDTVAESIGMGRTTFYKKFKSLTNLAPVEFVREMRLKRARQFLDAKEHNISEIAYAVGFNSAKYFSTCFKEKYGITPSEYIKSSVSKTL